jgi:hypothetical protein
VTRQCEIPAGGWPLIGIRHARKLLLIGAGERLSGQTCRQCDEACRDKTKLHMFHLYLLSLALRADIRAIHPPKPLTSEGQSSDRHKRLSKRDEHFSKAFK